MKELLLAWREPTSRSWIIVGKLWQKDDLYFFGYTQGVKKALQSQNFISFGNMNSIDEIYTSKEIFPIFKNRLFQKNRPEYSKYIEWLGFNKDKELSPLEELARTNGIRATDSLQLFEIPKSKNGKYIVYFYSHGISHLAKSYKKRIATLEQGERLFLLKDIQNSFDKKALLLRTNDPTELVGYTPRFYTEDFNKLLSINGEESLIVQVERVNSEAPTQLQLLCKLETKWPKNFKPFDTDESKLIKGEYSE